MLIKPIRAALLAAAMLAAAPALAQTAPAAAPAAAARVASPVVVVDIDRVVSQSAAGKFAASQLRPRNEQIQARIVSLRDQFQKEGTALQQGFQNKSITEEVAQTRQRDLQQRANTAQAEVDGRQRQLQADQQFVLSQINDAMTPIVSALVRERGAVVAVPKGTTLHTAPGIEITADVITRLDAALPRVNTTAPARPGAAPAAAPATPPRR